MLLGSAPDPRIQQEFVDVANQLHNLHHDRARFCLTYDEPLSHLVLNNTLQIHSQRFTCYSTNQAIFGVDLCRL